MDLTYYLVIVLVMVTVTAMLTVIGMIVLDHSMAPDVVKDNLPSALIITIVLAVTYTGWNQMGAAIEKAKEAQLVLDGEWECTDFLSQQSTTLVMAGKTPVVVPIAADTCVEYSLGTLKEEHRGH